MKYSKIKQFVKDAYPYPGWIAKVENMPPGQVFAIYKSIKKKGIKKPDKTIYSDQITIWDLLREKENEDGRK